MNLIYPNFISRRSRPSHFFAVCVSKSVFTPAYAILLETLIEARGRAGLTQAELARRLGRPQPFISYIERGERRIDVIEFYAIMKALGADPQNAFRSLVERLPAVVTI